MIVAMQEKATEEQIDFVIEAMVEAGVGVHRTTGATQTILAGVGPTADHRPDEIRDLPGVLHVHRISSPYKLAGRGFRPEGTVIEFANGVKLGGERVVVMAGPCSIENRGADLRDRETRESGRGQLSARRSLQAAQFALRLSGHGNSRAEADARCSPRQWPCWSSAKSWRYRRSSPCSVYVDCFQVGARNMQNFNLLRELGLARKPVLLKRGIAATIEELLLSSEYIMSGGNYDVILCERGIRTYETATRNTMDISAIPVVKKHSHLPIVGDPSHGTGHRDMVAPLARAAVAAGADGILVEVHPQADKSASDAAQTLYPDQFEKLMAELRVIAKAVGRTM